MENIKLYIVFVAEMIESIGVLTIFLGLLYALLVFMIDLIKKKTNQLEKLRQTIGKSILLGLEILIAADIILNRFSGANLKICLHFRAYCRR